MVTEALGNSSLTFLCIIFNVKQLFNNILYSSILLISLLKNR